MEETVEDPTIIIDVNEFSRFTPAEIYDFSIKAINRARDLFGYFTNNYMYVRESCEMACRKYTDIRWSKVVSQLHGEVFDLREGKPSGRFGEFWGTVLPPSVLVNEIMNQ
jgi:hypothetical protein